MLVWQANSCTGVIFGYFFDIIGFRTKSKNIQQIKNEDLNLKKIKDTCSHLELFI